MLALNFLLFALGKSLTIKEEGFESYELSENNFEVVHELGSKWMVNFYSEGCGHCMKCAPTWAEFVELSHLETNIQFGKLDC